MPKARRRSSARVKKQPHRPCTYELGYVRQDLYACRKCTKNANGVLSGFCRGCRDTCHSDCQGEVFELYTKRNFRCDCGNNRARNTCLLFPNKEDLNVGNERSYSHNFAERYCRCDSQYDAALPMAQCAMCEDWFHENCYRSDIRTRADDTDLSALAYELVCRDCVKTLPVLADYYDKLNAWAPATARPPRNNAVCVRPKANNTVHKPGAIDLIWQPAFRLHLCQCADCMSLYRAAKALWIVDEHDFVISTEVDDSDVLKATDDGEVVRDALDEELEEERRREERKRAEFAQDRIPRKASAPQPAPSENAALQISSRLSQESVLAIRRRINNFLRDSIGTNGGNLDNDAVLAYMSDLKKDMLVSFNARLTNAAEGQ